MERGTEMKKGVILFIVVLLLASSCYGYMTSAVQMHTSKNLTTTSLTYTFLFTKPTFSVICCAGTTYTEITMQDCVALAPQAGDPALPVKFEKLMLPPKTAVDSITVTGTPVVLQ